MIMDQTSEIDHCICRILRIDDGQIFMSHLLALLSQLWLPVNHLRRSPLIIGCVNTCLTTSYRSSPDLSKVDKPCFE